MFLGGRKRRCHKVRGMLSEYIDNRLDSEDRGVVERHLEICEACSNELESLQMTVQLLNQVPFVPAPRSFAIREADVVGERVPEPRRPGDLQPVPVFATGEVETGRVGILDLQRHRWLRPATAFATVALIVLLMVDFLQLVPHEVKVDNGEVLTVPTAQIMLSPTPEGEAYTSEERSDEPTEAIPEPAPAPGEEALTEDVSSEAGWPLRQIEIAMGVLVFVLVALVFFARRQRRRWSGV